ncbi:precorrin-2 dehydrogenase/sirohydrochlorin ferrochelatase family protein [Methanobrevibacter olleyae]|uniref:precorrin-2 dehydrogenase n=1 Tax=Methanobrevibacter olleyae TaxID=294671 RepID=A0A126R1D7_METOL|nr:bifunctional precorrin-2 dehydrogenase/sirohydrochlorin ferrochelatase [Methanobrevibacter olleyae]AMK15864.1 siroheme synthase CysG [Methanobrevibacter olleyae]SFL20926.1 precorrin-2 dehydrogenase / sirohydrochlorin ferrochelatase [Methanobrevibacter olleyae]
MGLTSLFLEVENKNVFILGTGEVATRRAHRFLDKGANVILAGNSIDDELTKKGAILTPLKNLDEIVKWSDIVVTASGDAELCEYIASISKGKLINRADKPEKGNIIIPTSFFIDNIEISIYTNGQSPLMARELRKKIQSIITEEDLLEIKLQDYARTFLKEKIDDQKIRKEYLYNILNNEKIKGYLKENKFIEAKELVEEIIKSDFN